MTTITLPRATVEQALAAMRFALHVGFNESSESQIKKADKASRQHWSAIRAIEAALAQQAEPVGEPVGYLPTYELNRLQSGHDGRLRSAKFGPSSLDGDVALYTATPQRKPLTEGVLMGVYIDFDRAADPAWSKVEYLLQFARAIERALEEKNRGR